MEHVTIRDVAVPALGIGTAGFGSDEGCRRAVETALEVGYRRVDTAQNYGTERAVGEAVSAASVDRDEVFVTTKLETGNHSYGRVISSTRRSVRRLGTDYVDLLLIHSPNDAVPVAETIEAMNELQDDGDVRHVGVSNFSVDQLRGAMDASETPIVANQVEYNPYRIRSELLSFCREEDVMLTAYSPLAVGSVADDPTLAEIGDRYGKTPSQVAIRWLVQQEAVSAIPKSGRDEHIEENFDVFDFELDGHEMRAIFELADGLFPPFLRRLRRTLPLFR